MRRQFTALRMHWGKGCQARSLDDHRTKTSAEGWLITERLPAKNDDGNGETKYYFSNLPAETPLKELATAVRSRWPTRGQFYEDGKQLCGLGDFQGRRWDGLHRHVALVMLSYSFLALTRWQAKSLATLPTLPEVHRQVLLALLTDLVQRWVQVKQPTLPASFAHLLGRSPPKKICSLTKYLLANKVVVVFEQKWALWDQVALPGHNLTKRQSRPAPTSGPDALTRRFG